MVPLTGRSSLPLALLLLATFSANTNASIITLLVPEPTETPPPSTRTRRVSYEIEGGASVISALAVAPSNGMTRYEEVDYVTRVVVHEINATWTLLSTPVPIRTYTVEHGASRRIASVSEGRTLSLNNPERPEITPYVEFRRLSYTQNCSFNEKEGTGVCVEAVVLGEEDSKREPSSLTEPYTYTGPLKPYATVTVSAAHRLGADLSVLSMLALFPLVALTLVFI